ncbi:MAG: hypothetical protein JO214_03420 [Frankiaceae bacterium]|nr:hypothetical protein [Frankiaceae bacterium]
MSPEQQRWAAVLSAPGVVALAGLTGLEASGVRVYGMTVDGVHIIVPRGAHVPAVDGVNMVVHESRRFGPEDVLPRRPPVVTSPGLR